MKFSIKYFAFLVGALTLTLTFSSCDDDDNNNNDFDFGGVYVQADQKARPAINTVFVDASRKDEFNETTPSQMGGLFAAAFQSKLLALNAGYTTNALGLDAATFTSVLATDVLNVATDKPTTFFDGTNVLTGRNLTDDVIDIELLLIFGGPDGSANPGLTSDNVDANDKPFLSNFPYLASPW
jgi:hypothetical protein